MNDELMKAWMLSSIEDLSNANQTLVRIIDKTKDSLTIMTHEKENLDLEKDDLTEEIDRLKSEIQQLKNQIEEANKFTGIASDNNAHNYKMYMKEKEKHEATSIMLKDSWQKASKLNAEKRLLLSIMNLNGWLDGRELLKLYKQELKQRRKKKNKRS